MPLASTKPLTLPRLKGWATCGTAGCPARGRGSEFRTHVFEKTGKKYSDKRVLKAVARVGLPALTAIEKGVQLPEPAVEHPGQGQEAAADFVVLPDGVDGTNCSNCVYVREGVCWHPELR